MDVRTDRTYFIGPLQPRSGIHLAIESLELYIHIIWIQVYRYNTLYKSGKKDQIRRINMSGGAFPAPALRSYLSALNMYSACLSRLIEN